jgi:hypothetical protein
MLVGAQGEVARENAAMQVVRQQWAEEAMARPSPLLVGAGALESKVQPMVATARDYKELAMYKGGWQGLQGARNVQRWVAGTTRSSQCTKVGGRDYKELTMYKGGWQGLQGAHNVQRWAAPALADGVKHTHCIAAQYMHQEVCILSGLRSPVHAP